MDLFKLRASLTLDTSSFDQAIDQAVSSANNFESDTRDMGKGLDRAESQAESYADALEGVARSTDRTGSSSTSAESDIDQLGDSIRAQKDAADSASGSTSSWAGEMVAAAAKGNLLATAIEAGVGMAKEFVASIWNLDEATEEYRIAQGKLQTAFEAAGFDAQTAQTAYSGLYRVLGETDRTAEASQLLAKLARDTEDVTAWSRIATGVVGTFGDSLPIESLIEASNETAKVGKVTGVLADALNWAGISEDDFNAKLAECANTTERTALITETLSQTYDDAADAFERNNETIMRQRDAQLRLQEAQAKSGEAISRLKTALTGTLGPALETVLGGVTRFVNGLANLAEKAEENTQAYHAMLEEYRTPLPEDDIEAAADKLEELKTRVEELRAIMDDPPAGMETYYGTEYAKAADQLRLAQEQYDSMTTAAEENTEALQDNEETMQEIIATADGVSVAIQGTGMTAEEASERLGNYTSAAQNLFDTINTESELSYEQMIANLEHNIQATEDFSANLLSIAGSLPPQLYDTFAAGGPQMYAGVVAMLAEANGGADEGLATLRALYEQGGIEAAQAFATSAGTLPVDMQLPTTVTAEAVRNDTSLETAVVEAAQIAGMSMASAVDAAGFDTAGARAMDRFIAGLESRRAAVLAKAQSIANAASAIINNALNSVSTYGGSYRAGGLDYIAANGTPIIAHRGEALLSAREAEAWRRGESGGGGITINQYIQAVPQTPVELAAATRSYFEQARWLV